ncbi:helix-turn-helix domain-containing protein [Arthrobacter pigmenti]
MSLVFRNLDVSVEDPVERWGVEGILTALERGNVEHWRKVARAVANDPRGKVAGELAEAVTMMEHEGMASLFERMLRQASERQERCERHQVVQQLGQALQTSGLTRAEFAAYLGTSTSRLSTYLTGKVVPSAVVMVRARAVAERFGTKR